MKIVMRHIFEKKRAYSQLPLFMRMRDKRIDALDRLAFYPCMAHFILSFGDINKYLLRYNTAETVHQQAVNIHTMEDDHHWPWYLEDLAKLGFDAVAQGSSWMRFLWSEELSVGRILTYRLAELIEDANPHERLVIIEAIEETGNVLFFELKTLAEIIAGRIGSELRYCGEFHFARETGHTFGADHRLLAEINLDPASQRRCLDLADQVFALFEAWTHELHAYALAHPAKRGVPLQSVPLNEAGRTQFPSVIRHATVSATGDAWGALHQNI